jgi:hypothetical protein
MGSKARYPRASLPCPLRWKVRDGLMGCMAGWLMVDRQGGTYIRDPGLEGLEGQTVEKRKGKALTLSVEPATLAPPFATGGLRSLPADPSPAWNRVPLACVTAPVGIFPQT